MSDKKLVLLSGGLDSTTLLAMIRKNNEAKSVVALNIYYGQRHEKELICARYQAAKYGVEMLSANLAEVFRLDTSCPLLANSDKDIPEKSYGEQLAEKGGCGTVETYVPFRNGLFLSYAATIALQIGAETVYYGAHADDAAGAAYPDCTPEFITAMDMAIIEGTGHKVNMNAPFRNLTKKDIVKVGLKLEVDYGWTWSCYKGKEEPCHVCATCIDREKAFKLNGVVDPLCK